MIKYYYTDYELNEYPEILEDVKNIWIPMLQQLQGVRVQSNGLLCTGGQS